MANFPTSIDTFSNPTSSTKLNEIPHAGLHVLVNEALSALETKVGVTGSAVTGSLDYLVTQAVDPGHTHTGGELTDADTLDTYHASSFSLSGHTHLGTSITTPVSAATNATSATSAYNSLLLGGNTSGYFATSGHNHNTTYSLTGHTHTQYASSTHNHLGTDITSQVASADTLDGYHSGYFATSGHVHLGLYYTETDMQTSGSALVHWGNLTNKPTTFDPSTHTHYGSSITTIVASATSAVNADTVDSYHSGYFATSGHDHNTTYSLTGHNHNTSYSLTGHTHLGTEVTTQVSSSDMLDGYHAVSFSLTGHTHTNFASSTHTHEGIDVISIVASATSAINATLLEGHPASYFAVSGSVGGSGASLDDVYKIAIMLMS